MSGLSWKGKRVVVTGASSGIGSEVARLAAQRGARVLAVSRSGGGPQMAAGTELVLAAVDLSTREGVDRTLAVAEECLGGVDVWIANAGYATYEKSDKADWDRFESMFRTNFFSACYAFEALRRQKGVEPFRFAVTASAMAYLPLPGYAIYSATKAAEHAYFESARGELASGQRVTVAYPIATRTKFFATAGDGPVPFPTQSPETVARALLRGIERGERRIYPSKLFRLALALERPASFIWKPYIAFERMKMNRHFGGKK
jgi:short-subunit dehydrogenase